MKLISSVISIILTIGVVWGLAQYLGDGHTFLSSEWFESSSEKLESFQNSVSDNVEIPDPESMDLPKIPTEANSEANNG